ncbi:hypothetical protein ACFQ1S_38320, partial [Kibdelosporangium lantanae]
GGFDWMTATVGGLWDSLLAEGKPWWITANSDSHNVYADSAVRGPNSDWEKNGFYNEDSGPTRTIIAVADNQVPNQTVTEFDSRARPTASILFSKGIEQWRTTTVYEGERTTTIPPAGGTPQSVVTNVQGRVAQVSQYVNGYTVGAANAADTTTYAYNAAGAITSMTDSSNNTWTAGYDMRGRRIWQTDPDAGKTTYAYDKAGQLTSTTDSRNKTQVFTYDDLGRRVRLNADSATGP